MASFGVPSLGAVRTYAVTHEQGAIPGPRLHRHRPPVCLNHIERFLLINPITKFMQARSFFFRYLRGRVVVKVYIAFVVRPR